MRRTQRPIDQAIDLGREVGLHIAEDAAIRAAEQLAEHLGAHAVEHAITFLGHVGLCAVGTYNAFELSVGKPAEQGEAIGRGLLSDQARFAGAMITEVAAPGLLPAEYVASQRASLVGTGSLFNSPGFVLATKIETDIAKGNGDAVAFRDALVSSVRMGIDAVHLRHVDSRERLDGLLAADPDFRQRYDTDAGFQIGVRAALWQAQVHPDDFANAERERGLQTTTIQLAQGA